MDQSKNGRPKMKEQTRPLIFEKVRSRVTREVSMPAKTADDLARYIEWASEAIGADPDEAMTLVMEHALGQFFARDRLFQDVLRARDDEERTKGPATTGAAAGAKPAPITVGKSGSTSQASTTGSATAQ